MIGIATRVGDRYLMGPPEAFDLEPILPLWVPSIPLDYAARASAISEGGSSRLLRVHSVGSNECSPARHQGHRPSAGASAWGRFLRRTEVRGRSRQRAGGSRRR